MEIIKSLYCYAKKILYYILLPIKRIINYNILGFSLNQYSQNGEDGIVEEIIRRLKIKDGWVVEFGAWNGIYLSNTFRVIEKNKSWNAVYIEGDKSRFNDLEALSKKINKRIIPICAFIAPQGENRLDKLLQKTPTPNDFDILSIDVDGIDYQIWQGINYYRPKIVIIEINSSLDPSIEQIHNPEHNMRGSSFLSTLKLGNRKGYTLICHTGNLIFVRNDFMPMMKIRIRTFDDQLRLYNKNWK